MRFYESLYVLLQSQAIIFYFVIGRDERVKGHWQSGRGKKPQISVLGYEK